MFRKQKQQEVENYMQMKGHKWEIKTARKKQTPSHFTAPLRCGRKCTNEINLSKYVEIRMRGDTVSKMDVEEKQPGGTFSNCNQTAECSELGDTPVG